MSKKISEYTTASTLTGAELVELVQSSTNKKQTTQQVLASTFAVTASGTDTYTATLSPAISSYTTNHKYFIKFTNANTGAATLNLNSIGAIDIKKNGATALSVGDISANQILELVYDGTNFQIIGGTSGDQSSVYDTDLKYFEQWDFITGGATFHLNGFLAVSSGSGAASGADSYGEDSTEKAIGTYYLGTGTTNSGRTHIFKSGLELGSHAVKIRYRIAPENLSDGTETYTIRIGLSDLSNISSDPDYGIYFRYTHSVNSGEYQAVTRNSGSETATDTNVAATTTYKIFEISINEAATSVTFKIDGITVATHSTNIPSGSLTNNLNFYFQIAKSAGTTERRVVIDWYDLLITRSTAR